MVEFQLQFEQQVMTKQDTHRRNRSSFGNPFRKGDKGLGCLASDEIEAEAEATHGAAVGKQPDRRRRRAPSAGLVSLLVPFSPVRGEVLEI